jgi:hypothetical protein
MVMTDSVDRELEAAYERVMDFAETHEQTKPSNLEDQLVEASTTLTFIQQEKERLDQLVGRAGELVTKIDALVTETGAGLGTVVVVVQNDKHILRLDIANPSKSRYRVFVVQFEWCQQPHVNGKWRRGVAKAWLNCSRSRKLQTLSKLPELLSQVLSNLKSQSSSASKAVEEMESLLKDKS